MGQETSYFKNRDRMVADALSKASQISARVLGGIWVAHTGRRPSSPAVP